MTHGWYLFTRTCLRLKQTGPLWKVARPNLPWEDFVSDKYAAYIGFSDWKMGDIFSARYRDINYAKVSYDEDTNDNDIAILVLKEEVEFSKTIRY